MSCGATSDANQLILDLTSDVNFNLPEVNLDGPQFKIPWDENSEAYKNIKPISTEDLTTRQVGGDGVFDAVMQSFSNHLKAEYEKGRITGAEYTKAYIALSEAAISNATQFLLSKEQSFWQAQMAQAQAITAKVALEQAKVDLIRVQVQARTQQAEYALAKMRLAIEDVNHCTAKFNLDEILPLQKEQMEEAVLTEQTQRDHVVAQTAVVTQQRLNLIDELQTATKQRDLITAQVAGQTVQTAQTTYNTSNILPSQKSLLDAQITGQTKQNDTLQYNLSQTLPAQLKAINEQTEAQRAQTSDTRSDGQLVKGAIGKQKDLHQQQIDSYKRDAEIKVAKIYADSWTVQKTIDEGLTPPGSFTNQVIDAVMTNIKEKNQI